ncbi:MAG: hypothetical protein J7D61_07930 [Marichromatium sp.]|nr:hypothetical protein [Marichromatium sp.]
MSAIESTVPAHLRVVNAYLAQRAQAQDAKTRTQEKRAQRLRDQGLAREGLRRMLDTRPEELPDDVSYLKGLLAEVFEALKALGFSK